MDPLSLRTAGWRLSRWVLAAALALLAWAAPALAATANPTEIALSGPPSASVGEPAAAGHPAPSPASAAPLAATDPAQLQRGAQLFEGHCSGCHVGGGNIIRRGRTLKLKALQRQGLDSPQAIAAVAANGRGQMSGYRAALGGDAAVADVAAWVWQQALAGWPAG